MAGALRVAGVGGDERGGHEPLHEVDLLGTGEAGPSGQSQRNRVAGNGPCRPVNSPRRRRVEVPEVAVHDPPQLLHLRHLLPQIPPSPPSASAHIVP